MKEFGDIVKQHEALLVVDSINRMFKQSYFSICKVDELMKVTGAIQSNDYHALKLYHCVHFSDMTREVKDTVFALTLKVVSNSSDFPEVKLVDQKDSYISQIADQSKNRIGKLL